MSDIHPFIGEKTSYAGSIKFWDDYADQYSGAQQGDIPERIVERLAGLSILRSGSEVLEIGSGPGTYSLKIAPAVKTLTCLDTSPRMLDRLKASAGELGIDNIRTLLMDWKDFDMEKSADVCIATLCPASATPESIGRLDRTAREHCVLVSWVMNHGDDLNAEIWRRLGKDYGYGFRSSTATQDWLRENGRCPTVEFFKTSIAADISVDALIAQERSAFRAYGVEADVEPLVREILSDRLDGDVLHYSAVNEMKLIYWEA